MPESSVSPESQRATSTLLELPHPIQSLLGYAGFAYVVGFITLVVNTARYGVPVFEFVKPINLWVGAVPTFAILTGVAAFRKWRQKHGRKTSFSLLQVSLDILIFIYKATLSYAAAWLFYGFVSIQVYWGGRLLSRWLGDSFRDPFLSFVQSHRQPYVLFMAAASLFLVTLMELFNDVKRNDLLANEERIGYILRYVITGVTIVILVVYIWVAYPRMPQRYGFGAPIDVKFVVGRELPLVLPREPGGIEQANEELWTTDTIQLLFRTDKEYVVRFTKEGNVRTVSVDAASIKAIIWP